MTESPHPSSDKLATGVETEARPTTFDADPGEPKLSHYYQDPAPSMGTKAYCGHIKPDDDLRPRWDLPLCVVCADLYGRGL